MTSKAQLFISFKYAYSTKDAMVAVLEINITAMFKFRFASCECRAKFHVLRTSRQPFVS